MKKVMRPLIATGALASLLLAGCTGGTGGGDSSTSGTAAQSGGELTGSITFQTWSLKNDKFTPYFENLVSTFEKEHPGTTIKWVDQPGDGYEDKLLQQAESGELPDVVNLPDTLAYTLAKAGQLDDLATTDPDTLKLYVSGGLKAYTFDGLDGTWAYPWYLGTDLSWWNTAQLKEGGVDAPPTTMDEFYSDALSVAQKTDGKVRLISSMPDITTFNDAGIPLMTDGEFSFNTPEAVELLQKYVELYKAGAMPADALNNDYAGNSTLFAQGKVAFTTSTPSFVNQLTTDAPSLLSDVSVSKRLATPPLFVQGLSIAKNSQNKALATAFAQFATNDENQIAFVKLAQGFLPGTIKANSDASAFTADDASPLLQEAMKLAAEEMTVAEPNTVVQYTDDMKQYTAQQLALALKGSITPQAALDAAVEYANQNLQQ